MARNKYRKVSLEEQQRLIELCDESPDTIDEFCRKHGIPRSSFFRWKKALGPLSESEKYPDKSIEEELRLEVLKLRIENERLKKKYTVKKTEDGKTEYVRLKMKNTR